MESLPHYRAIGRFTTADLPSRKMPLTNESMTPQAISDDIDSADLQALGQGDRAAFEPIVERWQGRLINYFYRSTGNRTDAEDLAQETFLELYRCASRYKARGTFAAFLFTLARRRLIDSFRKQQRRPLDYVDPGESLMQSQTAETQQTREIEEAFHQALNALPAAQRDAILLYQQQELSYDEIATTLDASIGAVKSWIHRARVHLREALKDFA